MYQERQDGVLKLDFALIDQGIKNSLRNKQFVHDEELPRIIILTAACGKEQ